MIDVDTIQPSLSDLMQALLSYPNLPKNSDAVMKIKKWLDIVESKQASESLKEEEVRQLKYDLTMSYDNFKQLLDKH